MINEKIAIASWSGGKDSCLACYKAMKDGYAIRYLLNFVLKGQDRCCFHGIPAGIVKLQAKAIGTPMIQHEVSSDMQDYEKEFKKALSGLRAKGISNSVFGDIYILDSVNWVERVCKEAGIVPVEPLWHVPAAELIEEFIGLGFKAVIVSCKADVLGKEFIGKCIDRDMVKEFKKRKICPCGENGEFHTIVVDGPLFKSKIEILESETILKEGFWKHWFLDIKKYR